MGLWWLLLLCWGLWEWLWWWDVLFGGGGMGGEDVELGVVDWDIRFVTLGGEDGIAEWWVLLMVRHAEGFGLDWGRVWEGDGIGFGVNLRWKVVSERVKVIWGWEVGDYFFGG